MSKERPILGNGKAIADFTSFVEGSEGGQTNLDRLTRFIQRRGLSRQDAEDVVGDVLERTWDGLSRGLDFTSPPRAYVFRGLRNGIIDRRQKERNNRKRGDNGQIDVSACEDLVEQGNCNVEDAVIQKEERRTLHQMVESLTPLQRSTIVSFHFEGHTHAETAQRLGKTTDAVKMAARRGVFQLRKKLGDGPRTP